MGEILLYIGSYTTPALVYDIHNYPEYSIAFEVKDSRNIYVAVNIRSRSIVSIHTLSAHLARDTILEYDDEMMINVFLFSSVLFDDVFSFLF